MELRIGGFLKRITGKRCENHEEFLKQRRNILFSRFALTAIGVLIVHTIQDLTAQLWIGSSFDILLLIMVIASLILNEAGYHRSSKTILIAFANVMLLVYCSLVPGENGIYLFFFPLIALSSIAFDPDQKKYRFTLIGLSVVSLLLLILSDFKVFGNYSIPAETVRNSMLINVISSALLLIVCIDFMSKTNAESELRLQTLANEVLCKNNDLEKTNVELDRFLYSTSHDLRAPISSIKGLIMIAKKETAEQAMSNYLSMMYDRTEKLDQFIHEIINYSRNARTQVAYEPVNMKEVLEEVAANFEFFEGAENVKIRTCKVDSRVVYTDLVRLKIILNNLVSNSVKYHDSSKEQPCVDIDVKYGKSQMIITIADNGIGVEEESQKKIFDMFYRGTDRSKGSGLGLYIVKEVIERMKGKIQITSTAGVGTQFMVSLPVAYELSARHSELLSPESAEVNLYSTVAVA